MQASTTVGDSIQKKLHLKKLHLSWQTLLLCLLALTFLAIGLWMRLRDLGLPAPRDDGEGVYWQSLRAMSACLRVIISPLCGALLTWL